MAATSEEHDNGAVLVVGPYGRRDQARFQHTVGYLLNMLVYKYEVGAKRMSEWSVSDIARESGRVIGETIERGANYPFSRLVRESGVGEAERLMDVMFVWQVRSVTDTVLSARDAVMRMKNTSGSSD